MFEAGKNVTFGVDWCDSKIFIFVLCVFFLYQTYYIWGNISITDLFPDILPDSHTLNPTSVTHAAFVLHARTFGLDLLLFILELHILLFWLLTFFIFHLHLYVLHTMVIWTYFLLLYVISLWYYTDLNKIYIRYLSNQFPSLIYLHILLQWVLFSDFFFQIIVKNCFHIMAVKEKFVLKWENFSPTVTSSFQVRHLELAQWTLNRSFF